MTFNEYQSLCRTTARFPRGVELMYVALGLNGEAGEVGEKVKKVYRDNDGAITPDTKAAIKLELGDVLYYLASAADLIGVTLEDIAVTNREKLVSRLARNVIHGSGDDR